MELTKDKALLFDLDGTLTDPFIGITDSIIYALKKFGITESNRGNLTSFIGPPLFNSFTERYGFEPEKAELAIKYYREYFESKGLYDNRVYDGIPESLEKLKGMGFLLLVATSKPEKFAKKIIEHFNLDKYFDYVAGASMDLSRSEKADVIAYCLKRGNIDRRFAVMVGDRKYDILGAKANNILSLGVLYGFGSEKELTEAGADFIAKTPEDLPRQAEKIF